MTGKPIPDVAELAPFLELTLLKPTLTEAETVAGCVLAREASLGAVSVKPCFVRQAVNALRGTTVPVGTVIGFPHGSNATHVKVQETKRALTEGALELAMPINLGYVRGGQADLAHADLEAVCGLAHMNGARVLVMIEFALLTEAERELACRLAVDSGADWVTRATGFGPAVPGVADVAWLRKMIGSAIGIKSPGPMPSLGAVQSQIDLGVIRVGISLADLDRFQA